jgi:hypothetical protein
VGQPTALVAAPLFLLYAGLGLAISRRRRAERVGPGMQGSGSFVRLQRAHGNAAEHIPLVLLGLFLLESTGGDRRLVLALGGVFVLARLAHASGIFIRSRHPLHYLGAATTYALEISLAFLLAMAFIRQR